MSTNSVEKNAQALNLLLRSQGKAKGKVWRQRIRTLLAQTFEALNAKPLDGELCLSLSREIEKELMQTESPESAMVNEKASESVTDITAAKDAEQESAVEQEKMAPQGVCERESYPAREPAPTGIPAKAPKRPEPIQNPEETGLFDLIHIQIRCLIWIRACVRPPYIGEFVKFADRFAEVKNDRIEKFLGVLSKGEDDFAAKTEVDIGYRDDLLPDMPERGLVLHPKRKKK